MPFPIYTFTIHTFCKGAFFRRGLRAAPFLFMEKNNDNSGQEQDVDFQGQEAKTNLNVKSVGRECPTHTGMIDLQAVADDNHKRSGEAVKAAFLAKACKLRIPVCKPWGDSERYDFVVDWGKGFWRVQVKGASYCERPRQQSKKRSRYQAGAGNNKTFTKEDMDFVVVQIVPEDL